MPPTASNNMPTMLPSLNSLRLYDYPMVITGQAIACPTTVLATGPAPLTSKDCEI